MEKPKLLLIEDDVLLLEALNQKFTEVGFEVIKADDGLVASKFIDDTTVNLIFLDIGMPKIDGITLLEQIRSGDKNTNTPVIVLSNLSDKKIMEEVEQLGISEYLVKSDYSLESMIKRAKEVVGLKWFKK